MCYTANLTTPFPTTPLPTTPTPTTPFPTTSSPTTPSPTTPSPTTPSPLTSDPTIYPTVDPTVDPTSKPTTDPTADPSSHPTAAPTKKLLGVFIKDRNGTFDNWLHRVETQIFNRRPRFLYTDGHVQSLLEYLNSWTIMIDLNTSDSSTEIEYSCSRHGKNPPLNEWIVFTRTASIGDRRRLLPPVMELFISPLFTEYPSPAPTYQQTVSSTEELANGEQSDDEPLSTSQQQQALLAEETSSNMEMIIIVLLAIFLCCFVCLSTYLYCKHKNKEESATENKISEMVNINPRTDTLEPIMTGENVTNETGHNQPGASIEMNNTGFDGERDTEKNVNAILKAVDHVKSYTDAEDTATNEEIYSGVEPDIIATPGGPEDPVGDNMNALYGKNKQPSRGFNENDIEQEDLYDLDDKPLPNEEYKQDLELQDPFGAGNGITADGAKDVNFMKWDHNDIANWVLNLDDGLFRKYESDIRGKLFEEDVSGEDLVDVNYEDIKGWGIKSFKHKKILANRIQELVSKRPASGDDPSTPL